MIELDDTTFSLGMLLLIADDEVEREKFLTYACEQGLLEREKAEATLDELLEKHRMDPLDNSKSDPEVRLAFARRLAEISGKTVEQVLAESDALDKQGRLLF